MSSIIPTETLKAIKNQLEHGQIQEIADEANYHRNLVTMLFDGDVPLNNDNAIIVQIAQRKIRENNERNEKLLKSLNKTLGK